MLQPLTLLGVSLVGLCPQLVVPTGAQTRKRAFPPPSVPAFGPAADYELAGELIADTEVNDFDGDGWLDLAVSSRGGEITILYGDGAGSLADNENFWAVESAGDPGPGGIGSADFNGDGYPDLVVSVAGAYNFLGQSVRKAHVYLNDGDRDWVYSTTVAPHAPFAGDACGGDFNEDGHQDVAVIASSGFDVFLGQGDGSFGPGIALQGSNPPTGFRIVSADVNADGHLDLVTGFGSTFPGTRVHWGDGTGIFSESTFTGPGYNFALGDLNGDGYLDTVSAVISKFPNYTGGLWVNYGRPEKTMSFGGKYGAPFAAPGRVAAADLNGDGFLDVAARDGGSTRLFLSAPLALNLQGQSSANLIETTAPSLAGAPGSPITGDWNHDGLADLAFPWEITGQTPMVRLFLNQTP